MSNKQLKELEVEFPNTEGKEFKNFIEKLIEKEVIEKKPLCRIMLFGSYYPPKVKELLVKIREELKKEGYINTWLVEDYPTFKDLGMRDKSLVCLEFADVNLFFITFEGEKGGVSVELEHVIKNARKFSFNTVVCHEIKHENEEEISSLSKLQEEGLISARIRMIDFKMENFEDLIELLKGEAWKLHYHYTMYENKY